MFGRMLTFCRANNRPIIDQLLPTRSRDAEVSATCGFDELQADLFLHGASPYQACMIWGLEGSAREGTEISLRICEGFA